MIYINDKKLNLKIFLTKIIYFNLKFQECQAVQIHKRPYFNEEKMIIKIKNKQK